MALPLFWSATVRLIIVQWTRRVSPPSDSSVTSSKTPVDHRLECVELQLRLSRRSVPTSSRRSATRSSVPPPSGVRALIPSIRRSPTCLTRAHSPFPRLARTLAARLPCSCRGVAWAPVARTTGPGPPDRPRLRLRCTLGNRDGPARALAAGIRLVHETWSTRRATAPAAGSGVAHRLSRRRAEPASSLRRE